VAPKGLSRTVLAAVLLGLVACSGAKKETAADEAVDLAAIRARRDSIRRAAVADSLAHARFTACSDSVVAELAKAAKKSKKKTPPPPEGMIPPEVLSACGKPPTPRPAQVAQAPTGPESSAHLKPDTSARAQGTRADTAHPAPVKADTARKLAAPPPAQGARKDTARVEAPKPALTAKQLQVLRADSIRQARERARQDSLAQVAERARQDSIVRAQRDSVRAESLKVARETEVLRETFTYAGGARDPFASLITEEKVGPEFNDLLLVGVYLDLRRASNSVAVLRDKTNSKRYKLRVGDRVGRLKVAQIRQTDVVFTVEDIGFERQETLSLRKKEDQTP
jgi:hypothetical protein